LLRFRRSRLPGVTMKTRSVPSTFTSARVPPPPRQPLANTSALTWPPKLLSAAWPISIPINNEELPMRSLKTIMRKQSGIALITTLLLLLLMSAMVVGFMLLVTEGQRLSGMNNEQSRAFYGAESGMEKLTADLGSLFATTYAPAAKQVDDLATRPPILPPSTGVSYVDVLGNSTYTITYPKDGNEIGRASCRERV